MASKTITITTVVDVVGALAAETLTGSIYLLDNNKTCGSSGEGTEHLKTMVKKGDRLVWLVLALECEAYVSIENILIDKNYCEPEKQVYLGTDVAYWVGTVKKDITSTPYNMILALGCQGQKMKTTTPAYLVGKTI